MTFEEFEKQVIQSRGSDVTISSDTARRILDLVRYVKLGNLAYLANAGPGEKLNEIRLLHREVKAIFGE